MAIAGRDEAVVPNYWYPYKCEYDTPLGLGFGLVMAKHDRGEILDQLGNENFVVCVCVFDLKMLFGKSLFFI